MVRREEPEKQDVAYPAAVDAGAGAEDDEQMDEGEDEESADAFDEDDLDDERELSAVNDALDDINDALDKLGKQNDQLNEQLRSILEASNRIQSKLGDAGSLGEPSSA